MIKDEFFSGPEVSFILDDHHHIVDEVRVICPEPQSFIMENNSARSFCKPGQYIKPRFPGEAQPH